MQRTDNVILWIISSVSAAKIFEQQALCFIIRLCLSVSFRSLFIQKETFLHLRLHVAASGNGRLRERKEKGRGDDVGGRGGGWVVK